MTSQQLKQLSEVMEQAFLMNEREDCSVFFDFYGHVNKFEMRIYNGGWKQDADADVHLEFYTDGRNDETETTLNQMRDELNKVLKGH